MSRKLLVFYQTLNRNTNLTHRLHVALSKEWLFVKKFSLYWIIPKDLYKKNDNFKQIFSVTNNS